MGGNVFRGAIKSEPIRKEDIQPTLHEFFKEFKRIFPGASMHLDNVSTLGSVGHKDVSGDIDIAIDESSLKHIEDWDLDPEIVQEYFHKFKARAKTATKEQLMKRAILTAIVTILKEESDLINVDDKGTGSGVIFTQFPQFSAEGQLDKYVQCDCMFGNIDWLKFSYYSSNYQNSNLKGLHRTQLVLSLFAEKGYTFNHGTGIKDKESGEMVATTPEQAVELLSKLYDAPFTREVLENYYDLQDFINKHLSQEERNSLYDRYLKILDSTRCDVPKDLQDYWLENQDRLHLTGKFLPADSVLYPFKD